MFGEKPSAASRSRTAVFRPEKERSSEPPLKRGTANGSTTRPRPGEAVDDGPAGVAEAGHLRDLVVGLARGVVPRPGEEGDPLRGEREDVRVASRDDEGREAGRERPRRAPRRGPGTGRARAPRCGGPGRTGRRGRGRFPAPSARPTRRAPTRPGPAVATTRPTSSSRAPGPLERLVQERREVRQVGAGRDLRDDAAVAAVHVDLRGDDGRDDRAVLPEEGDGGLVAGGLEAEDEAHGRARRRASPSACGRNRDPGLGDDGVDERGRRDVEGGVERRDARPGRPRAGCRPTGRGGGPRPRPATRSGSPRPEGQAGSSVVRGAATTNGTPCARQARATP